MKNARDLKYPSVANFFRGRCVFITGATGFVGKVLVEKLLRSCPEVDTLYLLLRTKRGQQPQNRLQQLVSGPIFEKLRDTNPNIFSKLRVVSGDVSEEDLGMSDEAWSEVRTKCSVVFHSAACVRFDMSLRHALVFNTLGTKRLLDLCKDMRNLESFVYVSTSYCHCDREVLGEEAYDPPADPLKVLDLLTWMDDDTLEALTPKLIRNFPNTYSYSKCLSEKIVTNASAFIPVAIARPSIVTGIYEEPIPGYVDNLNGPMGIYVAAGKGILRSTYCTPYRHADVVPVDFACNGLIVAAWHLANIGQISSPLVVNLTLSKASCITWGQTIELVKKYIYNMPFSGVVWYPDGSIKNSKIQHEICVLLFHNIPAYLVDTLLVMFRKKPFLVDIQNRLKVGQDLVRYYTNKEWSFTTQKLREITTLMAPEERKEFNTNMAVDWDEYIKSLILGARKYILKDDPSTLPKARRHMKRLYYVDRVTRIVFYFLFAWFAYSVFIFISTTFVTPSSEPSYHGYSAVELMT